MLFFDLIVHPVSCLTPYIPNKPVEFPLLNGIAMFVVAFLFYMNTSKVRNGKEKIHCSLSDFNS